MSLSVDEILPVTIQTSPTAPVARGFGTALILGQATVLALYRRIVQYASITEVAVDFATNTEEYKAAAIAFSQSPKPIKVKIGRRFLAAQAGSLRGGTASDDVGDYDTIDDGAFDITINGTNRQISSIDFTSATTMAQVATAIQTRLQAALASTTCTWDATLKKFIITSPTTGTGSIVLTAVAPTGGSSPTAVQTLLALTVDAGAVSVNGIAIESQTDSLNASAIFDPDFYFLTLTAAASTQDKKDSMAWTETNIREFFYTTNEAAALGTGDTGNLGYYAKNLGYRRSFGQYSGGSPYAAVSALARAATVDFDQPNSTITLKFKKEPGVAVDNLTSAQAAALRSYNLNFYTEFGGFAMLAEGVMADGTFQDEVHGLDWLQSTYQNAGFTKLATAVTKVPLTDEGASELVQEFDKALDKGRVNGLIAPGYWTGADLGEVKSGDYLPKGYYTFASPVAGMLQADRDARKAPPITSIVIGAGAIHSAAPTIIFQR